MFRIPIMGDAPGVQGTAGITISANLPSLTAHLEHGIDFV